MAIAILNPRHKNLRGAIGGLVVKHYGDKVVITRKPVFKNRRFSKAQKSCQEQFRQAALFANKLMSDPRARKVYEEESCVKGKPARSLMIADFLHSAQPGLVTLEVHDVPGREVTTLVNEMKTRGRYRVTWDATNMTSGVCFCRLRTGSYIESKKMMLIR